MNHYELYGALTKTDPVFARAIDRAYLAFHNTGERGQSAPVRIAEASLKAAVDKAKIQLGLCLQLTADLKAAQEAYNEARKELKVVIDAFPVLWADSSERAA